MAGIGICFNTQECNWPIVAINNLLRSTLLPIAQNIGLVPRPDPIPRVFHYRLLSDVTWNSEISTMDIGDPMFGQHIVQILLAKFWLVRTYRSVTRVNYSFDVDCLEKFKDLIDATARVSSCIEVSRF